MIWPQIDEKTGLIVGLEHCFCHENEPFKIFSSDRQTKALGHILEHDHLTLQNYERLCPEVNRRTLQRDLKAMIDKGLIFEKATSPTDPTKHYLIVESRFKWLSVTYCDTELWQAMTSCCGMESFIGYKVKLNLRQFYDTSYDKLMTCLSIIDD